MEHMESITCAGYTTGIWESILIVSLSLHATHDEMQNMFRIH